ncbi:hypothetical protein RJ639_023481 [Escallonia herrerae]|uniref:Ethylene insensitive 3-like DNA-binding domain-containing protein n=1 Tax=Escallonia herrerae TaxID=1293975 RepID=A0AA88UZ74_9ASTE|nr:hypothetical protein RJ639_023481 [Escallonia herrerae]
MAKILVEYHNRDESSKSKGRDQIKVALDRPTHRRQVKAVVAQEDYIRFALFCKPVNGASDNLRAWWKEKVQFDRNGLVAIAKYQADNSVLEKFEDCTAVASSSYLARAPQHYSWLTFVCSDVAP